VVRAFAGAPWRAALLLAATLLLVPATTHAQQSARRAETWKHLTDQLIADGIPAASVRKAYRDRRVGSFDGVEYALVVKESKRSYRDFTGRKSLAAARRCRKRYAREFETFGREHGVDPDIIAAILYVETRCGAYTGNRVALRQLSRLAMANEPTNVDRNIRRLKRKEADEFPPAEIERIARERASYLHTTFYPEVLAIFRLGARVGINPAGIRGSSAGAFGLPQFLPSSYLRFAQMATTTVGSVCMRHPMPFTPQHTSCGIMAGSRDFRWPTNALSFGNTTVPTPTSTPSCWSQTS